MIRATGAIAAAWFALYAWRAWVGHYSLATNAYDLSVFQYAIWSLQHGGAGEVPFYGHTIFSEHAMPILWLFVPLYALAPSAVLLLFAQMAVTAAAAVAFAAWQRRQGVPPAIAAGLVVVFLFSRMTHSAATAGFYPECLQALLTFLLVLAWSAGRLRWYWVVLVLLLMTKEDAGIYAAGFGLFQVLFTRARRMVALVTIGISVAWVVVAVGVVVPAFRAAEGRPASSPLIDARFRSAEGRLSPTLVAERWLSAGTASRLAGILAAPGFLPLAGPEWLAPAAAGIAINLAASPGTQQAGLMRHYAWPVLPWLFMAAAVGARRLDRRVPRLAAAWVTVVGVATLSGNPALQRALRTERDSRAKLVLAQLPAPTGGSILAQPNLIPHLPHTEQLFAIGSSFTPVDPPDLVLTTTVGNLWPLTAAEVDAVVARYRADARYDEIVSGPLFAFRRRR